jgi:hypothetical protein
MNQGPSQLLRIAREHVDSLPAAATPLDLSALPRQIDHALQAIVLSAAAAESAVNLALALPITAMRDHDERRYAAGMLGIVHRANIRQKIRFLLDHRQDFRLTPTERKKVEFLFHCRNAIMHSTPRYREYPATDEHTTGLSPEAVQARDGVLAVLESSSRSSSALGDARACFDTAQLLASRLKQLGASKEAPPSVPGDA